MITLDLIGASALIYAAALARLAANACTVGYFLTKKVKCQQHFLCMVGGYIVIDVWGFRKWHEWKWIKFSYKVNLFRDNVFPLYKLKTRHIGGFPWLIEYCCGTASQIRNYLLHFIFSNYTVRVRYHSRNWMVYVTSHGIIFVREVAKLTRLSYTKYEIL